MCPIMAVLVQEQRVPLRGLTIVHQLESRLDQSVSTSSLFHSGKQSQITQMMT